MPLSKLATSKSNRQSSLCLHICRASADPSPRSSSDPKTFRPIDDTRQGSQDIKHFQRNPLLRLPLLRLPSSTASLNPSHPTSRPHATCLCCRDCSRRSQSLRFDHARKVMILDKTSLRAPRNSFFAFYPFFDTISFSFVSLSVVTLTTLDRNRSSFPPIAFRTQAITQFAR